MAVAAGAAGELPLKPPARCYRSPSLAVSPPAGRGGEAANDGARGHNAAQPAGRIAGKFAC
jgi:hypothetical protein